MKDMKTIKEVNGKPHTIANYMDPIIFGTQKTFIFIFSWTFEMTFYLS